MGCARQESARAAFSTRPAKLTVSVSIMNDIRVMSLKTHIPVQRCGSARAAMFTRRLACVCSIVKRSCRSKSRESSNGFCCKTRSAISSF